MAALNTLRTKGAIVMTGAITFALLAFLLSDGNFMNPTPNIVVGTINGEEVSLKSFGEKVDDMTFYNQFISNNRTLTTEETEALNNSAWQREVVSTLFAPSTEALGLAVSDQEMIDMASGVYVSPIIKGLFADQTGEVNNDALVGFVSSLDFDTSGSSNRFWQQTETQMVDERVISKYLSLVSNGMFATDFEVDMAVKNAKYTYGIEYVLGAESKEEIEVSDAELKKFYEANIDRFKSEKFREIEYIVYETTPSVEDYAGAKSEFNEMLEEFKVTKEVEQFVALNSEEQFDARYYSSSNINPTFEQFAFKNKNNEMYISDMNGDKYIAARIVSSKMLPDSITIRGVAVSPMLNIDSLVKVIKSSSKGFAQVVANHSSGDATTTNAQTFNTTDILEPKLLNGNKGDVIVIDASNGAKSIFQIVKTNKKVKKVQLAKYVYSVIPSSRTEQASYALANEFADKVAAESANFEALVTDNALIKREAKLSAQDRKVNNIEDTKEIVRWAFNGEKGAVSTVISSGSSNYVVSLKEVFEGGFVPFEIVKEDVKTLYTKEQKEIKSLASIKAYSSISDAAKKLNTDVKTAEGITFTSFFIPGIGVAPELIGAIVVTPENKLSAPSTTGTQGVVFDVVSKVENTNVNKDIEKNMLNNLNATNIQDRVLMSLMSKSVINDNRIIYM